MQTRTVQVTRVPDLATQREIHEFFSFSGEIEHSEIRLEPGQPKTAFVTFKDPKALEIALLLSGATIVDQIVSITPAENFVPQPEFSKWIDAGLNPPNLLSGNWYRGRMLILFSWWFCRGNYFKNTIQNILLAI